MAAAVDKAVEVECFAQGEHKDGPSDAVSLIASG